MSGIDKNLNLTEEEYGALLVRLKHGDNTLFKKLFTAQSQPCINFMKQSLKVDDDTAYDYTIEAILVMRQRMVDGKVAYGNIQALFFQVAKHLYFKSLRKKAPISLDDQYDISDLDDLPTYSDEEIGYITQALTKLDEECQKILTMFYYQGQKLYDIATKIGKSHDAVRKQKERCIHGLVSIYNSLV